MTSTSDTIASHNAAYARTVAAELKLSPNDLVVEVGSNDGSLLKCFKQLGVRTLGIEPATNIAELARAQGMEIVNQFFNLGTAKQVRKECGSARAVIGNNVLAHVDDPVDFMRGCKELIEPDGVIVIEVPYLRDLVERLEYDTIYHEHLSYFSVTTLLYLCEEAGLVVLKVDRMPVHGGSLRMYAGVAKEHRRHSEAVRTWSDEEERIGLTKLPRYERLANDVHSNRRGLLELLGNLQQQGKTIVGYGAPAKGNTLLNYCGIDSRMIPYTVDKSPLKVGLYTPGAHLLVLPVSTLIDRQPDCVLILAWNFADEIMRQQQEYQAHGGRFIVPVPVATIVPAVTAVSGR